jgi:Mrp family chromosome partitioning ATPase
MKVAYMSKNFVFEQSIEKINQISELLKINNVEEITYRHEGLIFDQSNMDTVDLINLRDKHEEIKMAIIVQVPSENLVNVCKGNNITVINENVLPNEFMRILLLEWFGIEKRRMDYNTVFSVSGTHTQVGVTQLTLALASELSSFNLKVAVLGLNQYNPGDIPGKETDYSFDTLYSSIENGIFEKEYQRDRNKLKSLMLELEGFYYLVGNRDRVFSSEKYYRVEAIQKLIEIAKQEFDIVLLDLGSIYDTASVVAGLKCSTTHLLVGTQQDFSARNFKQVQNQILKELGYTEEQFQLIINKHSVNAAYSARQLTDHLGVSLVGRVPYEPGAEDIEIAHGLISIESTKGFTKAIHTIARSISTSLVEGEMPKFKKKTLFSFKGAN